MTKASWNKSVVFVGMDDIDDCSSGIELEKSWHEGFWKIANTITALRAQFVHKLVMDFGLNIYQQGKVGCIKGLFQNQTQNMIPEFQVTELRTHY